MYNLLPGTIEFYKGQTLFQAANWSQVPCKAVAAKVKAYWKKAEEIHVESEALKFYLLNHAFSQITAKRHSQEALTDTETWLANAYANEAAETAKRMIYYTVLIITRESRHLYADNLFYNKLQKKYGAEFVNFNKSIRGVSSLDAARHFTDSPPDLSIGQYVSAVTDLFNEGGFSGSFGGKPWGNIADTARKVIYGETTFEMFVDTAFTLSHNTGPMFNKGMLYHHQNNVHLFKILDVQRAGMIPQLILDGDVSDYVDEGMKRAVEAAQLLFPKEFSGSVDWYRVCDLGALHGPYAAEKAKQKKAKLAAISENKKFYVMPEVYAVTTTREAA